MWYIREDDVVRKLVSLLETGHCGKAKRASLRSLMLVDLCCLGPLNKDCLKYSSARDLVE